MHSRSQFPGVRAHAGAPGGLVILLCVLLCACAYAEVNVAYSVPGAPPPFPAEHVPAEDGYFSDAVFIGDSSMDDVEMFNLFPTANFVTKVGISPLSVNRREFRYAGSRELENMFDVVEKYPHKKIYILLGANSLDNKPSDQAMADYKKMMETFLERFPETIFYLIVPPAMTERVLKDLLIPPKRFANFRDMLISFAEERHCYIIDFYSLLLNSKGYMPGKYDCGDGVHPNYDGLKLLENEIRTHTVNIPPKFTFRGA